MCCMWEHINCREKGDTEMKNYTIVVRDVFRG